MTPVRAVLGAVGVAGVLYGLLRLLRLPADQVPSVLAWVGGGVVVHDGLVAPAVVALGVGSVVLARWARPALAVLLVVLGPLTLAAVPVLGRFGARPDNPTLLDRPYVTGWLALVGAGVVLAGVTSWWARRRLRRATEEGAA